MEEEMPEENKTTIYTTANIDGEEDKEIYDNAVIEARNFVANNLDDLMPDVEVTNKFDVLVDQVYPLPTTTRDGKEIVDNKSQSKNAIVNKKMKEAFRKKQEYKLEKELEKDRLLNQMANGLTGYIYEENDDDDGIPFLRSERPDDEPIDKTDTVMQTDQGEIGCDTKDLEHFQELVNAINSDQSIFKNENYSKLRTNLLKKAKSCKASSQLTHFLKCKHAFAIRVPQLLVTMRQDARVWMAAKENGGYKMDTEEEYNMITRAVLAAFMIDIEEMKAIALLSSRIFWNNAFDFNNAMKGKVGVTMGGSLWGKPWRGMQQSMLFSKNATANYSATDSTI